MVLERFSARIPMSQENINILYLLHTRSYNSELIIRSLSMSHYKNFILSISISNNFYDKDREGCEQVKEHCKKYGVKYRWHQGNYTYLDKIRSTANDKRYKYSIKMDEDIFLGPQLWDFIFDNIHLLDNEENLALSTSLSNGIPTCDEFVDYNFSEADKRYIYKLFSQAEIPNLWGTNFQKVRDCLKNGYNSEKFWKSISVSESKKGFLGMHPVRINFTCQDELNRLVIKNIHKFIEKRNYIIKNLNRPYFCNSFFAIKNDIWQKVINDKSLFIDPYDEIPINKYQKQTGKQFLYIVNGFGVHPVYALVRRQDEGLEQRFYNEFGPTALKLLDGI